MTYKENVKLMCQIKEIGPLKKFTRTNKSTFVKRVITLETQDGQILYCELRRMNLLDEMPIGTIIDVEISFAGSEKNGKRYNNIFINKMRRR
jgi:hypothetical protein